jgi:hypothetical protein
MNWAFKKQNKGKSGWYAFEARMPIFVPRFQASPAAGLREFGAVAQLVEQWTENPCVAGSIPARTTKAKAPERGLCCFYISPLSGALMFLDKPSFGGSLARGALF